MSTARQRVAGVPARRCPTRSGDVMYVDVGAGPVVLLCHGIYGGHDNASDMVGLVLGDGYRTVGPSRFGYLGSTLPPNATVDAQADAYADLLDHVGVDKALVVGYSAGGPSAIAFGLRHPTRVRGLILAASYLPKPGRLPTVATPVMRWLLGAQPVWWLLRTRAPRLLGRIMGVPVGLHPSPGEQAVVDDVMEHLFPIADKKGGAVFDTLVSEPASNAFPLENLTVPTLLVHAPDDPLAGYAYAEQAATRIPHGRLATINRGGHLFLGSVASVHAATRSFAAGVGAPPAT